MAKNYFMDEVSVLKQVIQQKIPSAKSAFYREIYSQNKPAESGNILAKRLPN